MNMLYKTEPVCYEAIKHGHNIYSKLLVHSDKINLEYVKYDGILIENVKDKTEELCIEAVKQNGGALLHIINQTMEICMHALNNPNFTVKSWSGHCSIVNDIEDRLKYVKDTNLREECRKYVGENARYMQTKSAR